MNDFQVPSPHPHEEVRRAVQDAVPEVASGVVQVRAIGRVPGVRTKIAVFSEDPNVDAVGSCVGIHARRIQAIVRALGGEYVDLMTWKADPRLLIKVAIAPFAIVRLDLFHSERRADLIVRAPVVPVFGSIESIWPTASELTGWQLRVVRVDAA